MTLFISVIILSFLFIVLLPLFKKKKENEKEEVLFEKKIDEADRDEKLELFYYRLVKLNKDVEKLKKHFIKEDSPPPQEEKPESRYLNIFFIVLTISFLVAVVMLFKIHYS